MRSYNLLSKKDSLNYITILRDLLANHPVNAKDIESIFNSKNDICLHQFLVYRLINFNFNKSLLIAISDPKKKLIYPLPKAWRKILKKEGFHTLHFQNSYLWLKFNIKWYLIGIATLILEIFRFNIKQKNSGKTSVYFNNLYPGNLKKNLFSDNIISWFCKQEDSKGIDEIYHSCNINNANNTFDEKIKYIKSPLPPFNSVKSFVLFFFWGLFKIFFVSFNLKNRLLFRELIFEKIFLLSDDNFIHKNYFFHNSGHLFRPLWTYEVLRRNFKVIFYFYSTNNYSFKLKNKKHLQNNQWQVVNWPEYWIWNQSQKYFLKKFVKSNYKAKIKGNIPFISSEINVDYLKKFKNHSYILVFDVQPYRPAVYSLISQTVDYYSEENCINFLKWINTIAEKLNIKVLIKRKRENKNISKKYLCVIKNYTLLGNWEQINPEIDPYSLMNTLSPLCTINMPYTSTAFISKENAIPAAYLDTTGRLDKNFLKSSKIPLINDQKDLLLWVKDLI